MRYVIKIGTSSLFNEDGSAKEKVLLDLLGIIKEIFNEGHEVVLVVSGAVACGKVILKQIIEKLERENQTSNNELYKEYKKLQDKIELSKKINGKILEYEKTENTINNQLYLKCKELSQKANITTIEKSVIAGIGQSEMMRIIQSMAFTYGILAEQMLLSGRADLKRSMAVKNIKKCLKRKILAVVNANDTVYEEELANEGNEKFSDNDTLASDMAREIKADRLFLITNMEGYLDSNNQVVKEITVNNGKHYLKRTKQTKSAVGSGGMYSKLENALAFAKSGGITFIISVENIRYIHEIGKLNMSAGTRICKNLTLRDKVKVILKNNIENRRIINDENSNRKATQR